MSIGRVPLVPPPGLECDVLRGVRSAADLLAAALHPAWRPWSYLAWRLVPTGPALGMWMQETLIQCDGGDVLPAVWAIRRARDAILAAPRLGRHEVSWTAGFLTLFMHLPPDHAALLEDVATGLAWPLADDAMARMVYTGGGAGDDAAPVELALAALVARTVVPKPPPVPRPMACAIWLLLVRHQALFATELRLPRLALFALKTGAEPTAVDERAWALIEELAASSPHSELATAAQSALDAGTLTQ